MMDDSKEVLLTSYQEKPIRFTLYIPYNIHRKMMIFSFRNNVSMKSMILGFAEESVKDFIIDEQKFYEDEE